MHASVTVCFREDKKEKKIEIFAEVHRMTYTG